MSNRYMSQSVTAITVAVALIATTAVSASAAPNDHASPQSKERIASLIDRVGEDQGAVATGEKGRFGTTFKAGSSTILIPKSSTAPVQISPRTGAGLEITLPREIGLLDGSEASDGTIVYQSDDRSVDAAVQVLDDGSVRMQTIINDRDSAHEFTYGIGERFQAAEAADGSIWVVGFSEAGEYQAFAVDDAWANDANGSPVSTYYEVRGTDLVQVVTPSAETVYPVVADPRWEWYAAAYGAGYSKAETRNLAAAGGVTGFCSILAWWSPGFAFWCGISGSYWFLQASRAANAGGCVFISVVPAPLAMRWLSTGCK